MRILLINDNSAHVNWGAQASPPALIRILRKNFPGCTITKLPHAWLTCPFRRMPHLLGGALVRENAWGQLQPIVNRCSAPERFYPEVADDFDYWADEWIAGRGGPQGKEFLSLAEAADIVVYNGENSIYNNTPEGCHGIFLLWLTKSRMGKPSCIVNHTAHLNDVRPILSGMVRLVFPALDVVAVREPRSFANLRALCIKNAELFPDVVFSLDPAEYSRDDIAEYRKRLKLEDLQYFCLSASGLPVSMPRPTWDGEVAGLVRGLKSLGLQAVLLAKDPSCQFLAEVAARTDSLFFGPEHGYHELWPLLEGASFLVSGHYHYAIFSAMVGCPFIPLSANNHKMQGVCEQLEWPRTLPFDATSLRVHRDDILSEALRLCSDRAALSANLLEKAALLRGEAMSLGKRLADVVPRRERDFAKETVARP